MKLLQRDLYVIRKSAIEPIVASTTYFQKYFLLKDKNSKDQLKQIFHEYVFEEGEEKAEERFSELKRKLDLAKKFCSPGLKEEFVNFIDSILLELTPEIKEFAKV